MCSSDFPLNSPPQENTHLESIQIEFKELGFLITHTFLGWYRCWEFAEYCLEFVIENLIRFGWNSALGGSDLQFGLMPGWTFCSFIRFAIKSSPPMQ